MKAEPRTPDAVLDAIRAPFLAAGGERVDPPILQPLSVLLDLAGEALRERLFVVQAEGGEEACLRPDFTVAVARLHLDRGGPAGRYLYEGQAFRAAATPGEADEFLQLGLEIQGPANGGDRAEADAEIAGLAWRAATAGGRQDLQLVLGDAELLTALLDGLDLEPGLKRRLARVAARPRIIADELAQAGAAPQPEVGSLAALLASAPEGEVARVLEEVWALAGVEPVGGRGAAEIAHRLVSQAEQHGAAHLTPGEAATVREFLTIDDQPAQALARIERLAGPSDGVARVLGAWRKRLDRLQAAGVPAERLRLTTRPGRAFDYYDGARFEVVSQALGETRPVAAGGRYDGLLARLGGDPGVAVGCMVRPWRAFSGGEA